MQIIVKHPWKKTTSLHFAARLENNVEKHVAVLSVTVKSPLLFEVSLCDSLIQS